MKKILIALFVLPLVFACSSDEDLTPLDVIDNNKYQYDNIIKLYNIPNENFTLQSVKHSFLSIAYMQDNFLKYFVFNPKNDRHVYDTDLSFYIEDKIENEKIDYGYGEYAYFNPKIVSFTKPIFEDDLLIIKIAILSDRIKRIPSKYNLYFCKKGKLVSKISKTIRYDFDLVDFHKSGLGYTFIYRSKAQNSKYEYTYFDLQGNIISSIEHATELDLVIVSDKEAFDYSIEDNMIIRLYDLKDITKYTNFVFEQISNQKMKNFKSHINNRELIIEYQLVSHEGKIQNIIHSINLDTKETIS